MLDIQKMHDILLQWENMEGGWSNETREESIAFIYEYPHDEQFWKDFLDPVPADILERYRKLIKMMLEEGLIDNEQAAIEESYVMKWGGKLLHRRGKQLAAELKVARDAKRYIDITPHECR